MAESPLQYHGRRFEPGAAPADIPPMPIEFGSGRHEMLKPLDQLDIGDAVYDEKDLPATEGGRASCQSGIVYSAIRISGNYYTGGLTPCNAFQSIVVRNATLEEAEHAAWTYFGMCGHSFTCFT